MNTEFVLNLINTPNYPPRYPVSVSMKYGRIKRKHGRVGGLDQLLSRIVRDCLYVSRIVPGRISRRSGRTAPSFKVQYATGAGVKCIYVGPNTVQEVFLICSDAEKTIEWVNEQFTSP